MNIERTPWSVTGEESATNFGSTSIKDADGNIVVWPGAVGHKTAERIVACVNACSNLPTEFLMRFPDGLDNISLSEAYSYCPKRFAK